MTGVPRLLRAAAFASLALPAFALAPAFAQDAPAPKYDYPTSARADYVIGCLAANGMKHEYLDKCSCGIDTIANVMSYDDYEKASTVLAMQNGNLGRKGEEFRNTPLAKNEVIKLREAEAQANLSCH